MAGMNETEIINDLWFKIHGLDEANRSMKDFMESLKDMKKEADLAEKSASAVIKKWSSFKDIKFNNISGHIYDDRTKSQVTNWARNTHATESHYAADALKGQMGSVDYNAARTAWKATQAELKKQEKIEKQITNLKTEILDFLEKGKGIVEKGYILDVDINKINEKIKNQKKAELRRMTENQREKNERAKERNALGAKRNEINENEYRLRRQKFEETRGSRAFRNAHPELFATGGQYFNGRYQAANAINRVGNSLGQLGVEGRTASLFFDAAANFARSPIAGAAGAISNLAIGVLELGKNATQSFAEIEAIKTQLGVVFSNQTQADSTFGEISKYAVKSPFGIQQTSELAVLLKQSGVYASDLMNTLKMLGDTAGGNMEKMKRIANNYAQIVSIGKASMLDMRQFAYAGIPIFEAVSKELGVSQQELRKLISDGKVTSDIIEKVFKDLTGINGLFENATEKGAKTLKARMQNLADARQLSFATIGEYLYDTDTQTGNDSFANSVVTGIENIYDWIKQKVNTVNIENDVNTLVRRDTRINELSKMLSTFKDNSLMLALVQNAYENTSSKRDVEQDRSIYEKSYQNKAEGRNLAKEFFGLSNKEDLENVRDIVAFFTSDFNRFNYSLAESWQTHDNKKVSSNRLGAEQYGLDVPFLLSVTKDERQNILKTLDTAILSLDTNTGVIEAEIRAHKETQLLQAQQLAFDKDSSAAGKTGSYASKFTELYGIERSQNSEEEQKKHIKELLDAQQMLRELRLNSVNGVIDASALGYKKYGQYMTGGVITPSRKLTVVDGKSESQKTEDRAILQKNYTSFLNEIKGQLVQSGDAQAIQEINRAIQANPLTGNNTTFYNNFTNLFNTVDGILKNLSDSSPDKKKVTVEEMRAALLASTMLGEIPSGGDNADVEKAFNKTNFVPLWKRILAQYTGLTTTGMTDTMSTLGNYKNDMAIRNITSGVMSAALKDVGLGAAIGLLRGEGVSKLKGDTSSTIQTDWLATKQNLHEFATSLSAATSVVSAYRKGLEDELEVYEQLIVAGSTQGESQDANQQKYLSDKQIQKMKLSNAQLVNAFGDTITTADGQKYTVKNLAVNDEGSLYVKETGEVIKDQIKVESNLTRFLEQELPRLTKEIHEATAAELRNQTLNKMFQNTAPTQLMSLLLASSGSNDTTRFLSNNSDYLMSDLKTVFKEQRIGTDFADTAFEDFVTMGLRGQGENATDLQKSALELLIKALEQVLTDANTTILSGSYGAYSDAERAKERDDAVTKALLNLTYRQENAWKKDEPLTPYNYAGIRGVSARFLENGFGLKQSYDIQDLYNAKAKENGVDKLSFGEKMSLSYTKGLEDTIDALNDFGASLEKVMGDFGKDAWVKPFETMTENLVEGKDALDGMEDVYKGLTADMLSASSAAMQKAGWELVAMGAADRNVAMIAGGLALAAAGGAAAGLGNVLKKTDSDKKDDKVQRLEDLKNDLADLLRQAREDALYYEKTLRHKKALSANDAFTMTSVNDAVITPRGDVVKTDPKDYLIATKTPNALVGGGSVPKVTFNLIDQSTGVRVASQKTNYNPETNTYEIVALIENKVKEVIATSAGDEAFEARAQRQRGRMVIA